MENFIAIIASVLFVIVSCKPKNQYIDSSIDVVDTVTVSFVDSVTVEKGEIVEETEEKPINIDSVLQANIDIDKELTSDSIYNAISPVGEYELYNGQVVAFTRLEKEGDIYAIVCPNVYSEEQAKIDFYMLQNKKWKYLHSSEVDNVVYFQSVDLNNDGISEIQSIGHFNMNGNCYNYFFGFSKAENKFYNGGYFFSSIYEFKPKESRIEVVYEGSWYMPFSQTIYYWKNHKLIPYKEVEVSLKIADMKHHAQYIKYSENLNLDKDSLELKFKKNYRGKKLNEFYDKFFENN
ncbi:hypothetical protein [Flavobacterium urocaniciphilum]|uniref:Uncharacterized protein n=1 Tax=Flavobacterium urocaniciphilum TaxID=1299341 RepID=A0A1H9CGD4_9FLAO|nr:hypothetical protein [Flavobacterium urocaniciphilum]SEQ00286.1 hypothetical protein SAMN05444005_104227 [Flavobacterium urocaniciphilum]